MSTPEDIQRLIRISQRRLQRLREQAALFGISTPPHIAIEIEDTEAEIARLREELRQASGGNITTGDIQAEGSSAIAIGTGSGASVTGGGGHATPNPGGSSGGEYNTATIRKLLKASFTDDDELTIFCADHFPEVEAKFNSGMSRIKKIHLLIQHCQAHLAFDRLLALMRDEYPAQYEKYRSQL